MRSAEVVNPNVRRGPFRAVLFDFDGTLSSIREGWPRVMVGMMLDRLRGLGMLRDGDAERLDDLVMTLNGQPTVRQMEAFAAEVTRRGGLPADPGEYLREYADRLMGTVRGRCAALESGTARAADWVVPGAHALLADLRGRGAALLVASGTDHAHVSHEARLLGVDAFFPAGIDAPRDGDATFTKAAVIARVLAELGLRGEELLGFGDGVVETAEVKRVGGVAVGVASAEPGSPPGTVEPGKRARLIAAGADVVVPDYAGGAALVGWLWGG